MGWVMRLLEKLGLIKPRYVAGWPRGVIPIFSTRLNYRVATEKPELWENIRHLPISRGYEAMCASVPGLWERVRHLPYSQALAIIEHEIFGGKQKP